MSYISREEAIKAITDNPARFAFITSQQITALKKLPTADVVEVRRGEWYKHDKKKHGDTCYYCSVCEKMALADYMIWKLTDYCPHCGAKMDGERREE